MRKLGSVAVLLAVGAACTYVSNESRDVKIASLDQDGDGSLLPDDCDDLDADRTPGKAEIPYDRIDQDCDQLDLLDVDGDGTPGISQEDYSDLEGSKFLPPWPGFEGDPNVDCQDDPAVHPEAASIEPGLPDEPYDGIDANCDGDNDFDDDGDGYVKWGYDASFQAFVDTWGYTFDGVGFGDCEDDKDAVNPGVTEDTPYNKVDADCDGQNEFDLDNDGYVLAGTVKADYDDYVAQYALLEGFLDAVPYAEGDCLDAADTDLPGVDPAEVNPGATEVFYDGVDGNCDGGNDFDQDMDGFVKKGETDAYNEYLADWGLTFDGVGFGDCKDSGSVAGGIFPGAIETLGDGNDQDCNGNVETADFQFGEFVWEEPGEVIITANDLHYLISVTASSFQSSATPAAVHFLGGFRFDLQSPDPTSPHDLTISTSGTYPWSSDLDVAPYAGGLWFLSSTFPLDLVGAAKTFVYKSVYNSVTDEYEAGQAASFTFNDPTDIFQDFDITLDADGSAWVVSCGATDFASIGMVATPPGPLLLNLHTEQSDAGDTCVIEFESDGVARSTQCDGTGCWLLDVTEDPDDVERSADAGPDWDPISVDNHNGVTVVVDRVDGMIVVDEDTEISLFEGENLTDGDAVMSGADLYAAGILADGTVELRYGQPDALTTVTLPFEPDDANVEPARVGVYADSKFAFVAVSGVDPDTGAGAVGWLILGL